METPRHVTHNTILLLKDTPRKVYHVNYLEYPDHSVGERRLGLYVPQSTLPLLFFPLQDNDTYFDLYMR